MCPPGSDHSDLEPGPNPLRAISTPRASRAERMALGVKPRSMRHAAQLGRRHRVADQWRPVETPSHPPWPFGFRSRLSRPWSL